jgi:hypothetical protein
MSGVSTLPCNQPNFIDETGKTYVKWKVVAYAGRHKKHASWLCRCGCGVEYIVRASQLRNGLSTQCILCSRNANLAKGSVAGVATFLASNAWQDSIKKAITASAIIHTTHGHTRTGTPSRTYTSWRGMNNRCYNPKNASYNRYGLLGVEVCLRWRYGTPNAFENFLADNGERPEGTTLGRFGDIGNYEPSNCKWMTPKEQAQNRRKRNRLGHEANLPVTIGDAT